MRDARFELSTDGSRYRNQLIDQGRVAANEPWFSSAVETITAWCVETVRHMGPDVIVSEESVIAPDEALRKWGSGIAGATNARLTSLTAWSPRVTAVESDPQADWTWGVALAQAAIEFAPHAETVLLTWRTVGHSAAAVVAYLERLARALKEDRGDDVLSLMAVIAERVHDLRCSRAYGDNENRFAAALASWWDTARLDSAWDLRSLQYAAVWFDEAQLLDAVRRADPARFLALIEEMHNPLVARELLQVPEIVEDFEEIVRLLASAPSTQVARSGGGDADDSQSNHDPGRSHRLTAPLLLGTALEHSIRLASLQSQAGPDSVDGVGAGEPLEQELFDRFQQLTRVALDRVDGSTLVAAWMMHLAREVSHTPAAAQLLPARVALHAGARTLIARPSAVAAYQREAQRSLGGRPSLDHVIVLVALACEYTSGGEASDQATKGQQSEIIGIARAALVGLLDRQDGELSTMRDKNPPSWCHAYAAVLFVQTHDPVRAWHDGWLRLAEQRRPMFHRWFTECGCIDDPSLFLLYTGAAACWSIASRGPENRGTAFRFWDKLYDAAQSVALRVSASSERWPRVDTWRGVVVHLLTCLAGLLRETHANTQDWQRASRALWRLGGDDELLIEGIARLIDADLTKAGLMRAIDQAGVPLRDLLRRYRDTVGERRHLPEYICLPDALSLCEGLVADD